MKKGLSVVLLFLCMSCARPIQAPIVIDASGCLHTHTAPSLISYKSGSLECVTDTRTSYKPTIATSSVELALDNAVKVMTIVDKTVGLAVPAATAAMLIEVMK